MSMMYHDLDNSWERLQFNRMRAQLDDQEAELREKDVRLALLYHELEGERLRHAATSEALGRRYEGIQRSVDAGEVVKTLSALADTVEQLRHQQEMLLYYLPSGGCAELFSEGLPLSA
jgi:hypothetical protein